MYVIAWFFFFVVFRTLIPAELARDYLAGALLLGAAPCTAMVFVWSHAHHRQSSLYGGEVATNGSQILDLVHPHRGPLLGLGGIRIPLEHITLSVLLFDVLPLAGGSFPTSVIKTQRFGVF